MRQDTDRTQVWWIAKMLVRKWFRTLGVSVCVCSLDGESCECELCLGLDGGYGEGGKIGRCHYSATLPSLFLGHKRLLKNLNLQVKQINIARSAKVVLHKLPGKSSLNVSFLFPIFPAYGHHNHHDRVRFPKKCLQLGQFGPPALFVVYTPIYGVTALC